MALKLPCTRFVLAVHKTCRHVTKNATPSESIAEIRAQIIAIVYATNRQLCKVR